MQDRTTKGRKSSRPSPPDGGLVERLMQGVLGTSGFLTTHALRPDLSSSQRLCVCGQEGQPCPWCWARLRSPLSCSGLHSSESTPECRQKDNKMTLTNLGKMRESRWVFFCGVMVVVVGIPCGCDNTNVKQTWQRWPGMKLGLFPALRPYGFKRSEVIRIRSLTNNRHNQVFCISLAKGHFQQK